VDVKIPPKVELTEVKPLIAAEIIHFNFHIMLFQSVIDWESRHLDILAAGKLRIESHDLFTADQQGLRDLY